jgi:hypothetical protein
MDKTLFGQASAPRALRLALAAALVVPLLAACGSEPAGGAGSGSGSGNGAEVPPPTSSAPPATPAFCGLNPAGQAARSDGTMAFPATTEYIGKSLEEARALATSRKLEVRVVGEDGSCNAVTDDLRTTRVNVYVENGTVVASGAF